MTLQQKIDIIQAALDLFPIQCRRLGTRNWYDRTGMTQAFGRDFNFNEFEYRVDPKYSCYWVNKYRDHRGEFVSGYFNTPDEANFFSNPFFCKVGTFRTRKIT